MSRLPAAIEKVIGAFGKLPSVGPKSAQRLTFYLLRHPQREAGQLAEAIANLHAGVKTCARCHYFAETEICEICSDPRRDATSICVVEEALNVVGLEKTAAYQGQYHVLGGALSPLKDVGPESLNIESLVKRVKTDTISEVILATNPTVEGEATAVYLARLLAPLNVSTSRLAQGLPAGGDLEYTDSLTLQRAFEGRQRFDSEL